VVSRQQPCEAPRSVQQDANSAFWRVVAFVHLWRIRYGLRDGHVDWRRSDSPGTLPYSCLFRATVSVAPHDNLGGIATCFTLL
jgi:hypothetical protein